MKKMLLLCGAFGLFLGNDAKASFNMKNLTDKIEDLKKSDKLKNTLNTINNVKNKTKDIAFKSKKTMVSKLESKTKALNTKIKSNLSSESSSFKSYAKKISNNNTQELIDQLRDQTSSAKELLVKLTEKANELEENRLKDSLCEIRINDAEERNDTSSLENLKNTQEEAKSLIANLEARYDELLKKFESIKKTFSTVQSSLKSTSPSSFSKSEQTSLTKSIELSESASATLSMIQASVELYAKAKALQKAIKDKTIPDSSTLASLVDGPALQDSMNIIKKHGSNAGLEKQVKAVETWVKALNLPV